MSGEIIPMMTWLQDRFPRQPVRWAQMLRILCNLRERP
jgi:hypothetical protein